MVIVSDQLLEYVALGDYCRLVCSLLLRYTDLRVIRHCICYTHQRCMVILDYFETELITEHDQKGIRPAFIHSCSGKESSIRSGGIHTVELPSVERTSASRFVVSLPQRLSSSWHNSITKHRKHFLNECRICTHSRNRAVVKPELAFATVPSA